MIGTLPAPYPDEILYSVCARFSERMHYPSKRSIISELLGTGNAIACVGLPSHIDDLVAAFPPGHCHTPEDLIDHHTLLPFYAPFIPQERLHRLQQDMYGRNGPAIHMRAGIMASRVSLPERLRLCPCCIEEDRQQFGECYWHRVHQVPGVVICPIHEISLHRTDVPARNVKTRYEFISAESAVQSLHHVELQVSPHYEILLNIARDAHWLLIQHCHSQGLNSLHSRYRIQLIRSGLATYKGRIDIGSLLARFCGQYPPDILSLLHCELDERVKENWLVRLVRVPTETQHPLHHLLLIHLLGHTAETFFCLSTERQPFGDGPWPCLNPVCKYYRERCIEHCKIVYSQHVRGKPIGIFACSCGFTYSRTGPDTSSEDQFSRSTVQSFGHIWETRLQVLWQDETVSLRRLAQQLGVDPLTVKRHATRLGLSFPRPGGIRLQLNEAQLLQQHEKTMPAADVIEAYRAIWLATVKAHPRTGVKQLRAKVSAIYTWLYRNDYTWLKKNIPKNERQGGRQGLRVDWEQRDARIAEEVEQAVQYLKTLPGRPIRITRAAVGRVIDQLALIQQHYDKLPKTTKILEDLVESREAFALRRIAWAQNDFQKRGILPKHWMLLKRAGVARLAEHPLVKEALSRAVHKSP